mmetsp:Transcript_38099/g.90517  ORF Transcript_38099/g.90517 Transcript_38099/m.90517 type:complete len:217 (+) Transcript_38099:1017-1667(+)
MGSLVGGGAEGAASAAQAAAPPASLQRDARGRRPGGIQPAGEEAHAEARRREAPRRGAALRARGGGGSASGQPTPERRPRLEGRAGAKHRHLAPDRLLKGAEPGVALQDSAGDAPPPAAEPPGQRLHPRDVQRRARRAAGRQRRLSSDHGRGYPLSPRAPSPRTEHTAPRRGRRGPGDVLPSAGALPSAAHAEEERPQGKAAKARRDAGHRGQVCP